MLWDDDGHEIKQEEEILNRVHKFYAELYTQPTIMLAEAREQTRALSFVDQCVTEEDNRSLVKIPEADEIQEVIKSLPQGKVPGEDGLPVEVLRELWEEMSVGCLAFVQEAWKTKRFTKSFKLECGVRQGCPMSPLLFAISTQPLMRLLREGERRGEIVGVNVPRGKTLLHRLFVDDSGVSIKADENNFRSLCSIIGKFERMSGAKLNPAKSTIIPFALENPSNWLLEMGYQVLKPGQYITYLGCRFGVEKNEIERVNDIRNKLQKKLSKWANRFLTWSSRVLLQHVLKALPIYHFLGLGLQKNSYKGLETPCRTFLWGTNTEGRAKTALVRWDSITKLKKNGGLQIKPFQTISEVLKMRYIGRLLNRKKADWSQMMRYFIGKQMQKRKYCREVNQWSVEEGLILLPPFTTPQSKTTNHILQSWFRLRKFLKLDSRALILPGSITLRQLLELLSCYTSRKPFNERVVYPLLKRMGVTVLTNMATSQGTWLEIANDLQNRGVQLNETQTAEVNLFQIWLRNVQMGVRSLQESTSWKWEGTDAKWNGWQQSSQFWHKHLDKEEVVDDLSSKWPEGRYDLTLIDGGSYGSLGIVEERSNEDEPNQTNEQTIALASRSPQHNVEKSLNEKEVIQPSEQLTEDANSDPDQESTSGNEALTQHMASLALGR
ncbi:hypothetical protein R1flu_027882 [Riccia fluitans]|uniref:Reverse transcriptase domain-containing protein n=1 Tax=Riccia fluitans TaxID=41844 RepID=A0ABD1XK33_9MARC